ncbi:hypothetical protein SDC9_129633 [bioreactor metagenome]|uniref:Uncharacterized protein n=1 Tax=bioreactor metagenome TaxID=1076179 RepID=A0A645D1C5_9ZZZZ
MQIGERRHTDHGGGVAAPDQPHQFGGVVQPLRMAHPRHRRPAGHVTADRQDVVDPGLGVAVDHLGQLVDRLADAGQMPHHLHDVGLGVAGEPFVHQLRQACGDRHRHVAPRAVGTVRHRDEVRFQVVELAQGLPQHRVALEGLGREELEGMQRTVAGTQHLVDGPGRHGAHHNVADSERTP